MRLIKEKRLPIKYPIIRHPRQILIQHKNQRSIHISRARVVQNETIQIEQTAGNYAY